jgi:hypothetical protein
MADTDTMLIRSRSARIIFAYQSGNFGLKPIRPLTLAF